MTIKLYASSFAGFVGKNPYAKQHEVFESVWEKFSPETYHAALKRNGRTTDRQRLEILRKTVPEVEVVLHSAESSNATSATHVTENQQTLVDEVPRDVVSSREKKLIEHEIRKQLYTRYGTARERSVVDVLVKDMGMRFVNGIEYVTYSKTYRTANNTEWVLSGKIDALTEDATTIIEIKNRVKRLFMHATTYERIQVECYLRLIETATRALLVEALGTTTLNIIHIDKDDRFWAPIFRAAEVYVDYLHEMVATPSLQDTYFQSKTPSAFLRHVCTV